MAGNERQIIDGTVIEPGRSVAGCPGLFMISCISAITIEMDLEIQSAEF
jgi:hypothetical protein